MFECSRAVGTSLGDFIAKGKRGGAQRPAPRFLGKGLDRMGYSGWKNYETWEGEEGEGQ